MSTQSQPHRPLIDPARMEEAGRALRRALEKLREKRVVTSAPETEIAWEDGEPRDDQPRGL